MNISQILASRTGRHIVSIEPKASVKEALKLMAAHEIGALLVMSKGKLVGLVSERDYARKVSLEGKSADTTLVEEIMTRKLISATRETGREEAMALMVKNNFRHLPVLDAQKTCIGIVSMRDLVQDIEGEDE